MENLKLESACGARPCVTVQAIGSSLVASAIESLVVAQAGYSIVREGGNVIILIGAYGMDVARRLRLHTSRARSERYILISDGAPIDFALVRSIPIKVFMAADESVSVFVAALEAAAAGTSYCSSQMVPVLVESSSRGSLTLNGNPEPTSTLERMARSNAARQPWPQVQRQSNRYAGSRASFPSSSVKTPSDIVAGAERIATALGLSEREWDVSALAIEGLSNCEISEKTMLSVSTVKFLLYRTYQKLGIRRRAQLASALMILPNESVVFAASRMQIASSHSRTVNVSVARSSEMALAPA